MSDITLIIRGPLDHHSIQNIPKYFELPEIKNIIVTYWEDGTGDYGSDLYRPKIPQRLKDNLNFLLHEYEGKIKTHVNKYNELPISVDGDLLYVWKENVYKWIGIQNALKQCDTEYMITLRSDSSYPDLKPFVNKVLKNPDKIITCDVNFRPDRIYKFHPGEHITGGRAETFRNAITLCFNALLNPEGKFNDYRKRLFEQVSGRRHNVLGEQLFCASLITVKGDKVHQNVSKELMHKHFDVVSVWNLGAVEWTAGFLRKSIGLKYVNLGNKYRLDDFVKKHSTYQYISNMSQL